MRRLLLTPLLLTAGPAAAQMPGMPGEPGMPETPDGPRARRPKPGNFPPRPKKPREFELGVEMLGYFGGSFLSDLTPSQELTRVDGDHAEVTYGGFSGPGGGGGLGLTGAWRGILGFEVGAFYVADRGSGEIGSAKVEMSQWAIHAPALLRITAPIPYARPALMLGVDVVFPFEPDVTSESELEVAFDAAADPYVQIAGGLGFEFSLPFPSMDLRLPLMMRFAWNPVAGNHVEDRVETDGTCTETRCNAREITLRSEWGLQLGATMGLAWYFH